MTFLNDPERQGSRDLRQSLRTQPKISYRGYDRVGTNHCWLGWETRDLPRNINTEDIPLSH